MVVFFLMFNTDILTSIRLILIPLLETTVYLWHHMRLYYFQLRNPRPDMVKLWLVVRV